MPCAIPRGALFGVGIEISGRNVTEGRVGMASALGRYRSRPIRFARDSVNQNSNPAGPGPLSACTYAMLIGPEFGVGIGYSSTTSGSTDPILFPSNCVKSTARPCGAWATSVGAPAGVGTAVSRN
jgi:hypothetical protein